MKWFELDTNKKYNFYFIPPYIKDESGRYFYPQWFGGLTIDAVKVVDRTNEPEPKKIGYSMTPHDQARLERAKNCDRSDLESLRDAVVGLQSTDDPSLVPLHDELLAELEKLEKKNKRKKK